jgi:hypothetical protein
MTDSNMMPVIGLGTLCLTSQTLKQMGFKNSSMPFDWIFSSPEMVEHAIADDFREFLDRKNLKAVPNDLRPELDHYLADNVFYRDNFGMKYIYNHHNPDDNDDDYDYFCRCVDRFRSTLNSSKKVLFVMFQHYHGRPGLDKLSTYGGLAKLLYPHSLLCVEAYSSGDQQPSYRTVDMNGNLEVGQFGYTSPCDGLNFGSLEDYTAVTKIIEDRCRISEDDHFGPSDGVQNQSNTYGEDTMRRRIVIAQGAERRALDLLSGCQIELAQANARTEAVQSVLSAVIASQGWRGLNRKKFRRLVAEAGSLVPNNGPLSVQHEVLLAEARKVLNVKE